MIPTTCGTTITANGCNAHCELLNGHPGPHEMVIEFKSGCDKCKWEPHDMHRRELLLPPGYIECEDCTAVTEVVPQYLTLSQIKYRKKLCADCYELAREGNSSSVGSAIHASLVTAADPSTLIALGTPANVVSGGGYARQAHSFADDFARPAGPIKAGDMVTFSWTGEDDGGLWIHGSPADG